MGHVGNSYLKTTHKNTGLTLTKYLFVIVVVVIVNMYFSSFFLF